MNPKDSFTLKPRKRLSSWAEDIRKDFVPMACLRSALSHSLFRTITGQVEHLDHFPVFFQPCFDWLAVMHPQVVQNQEDFSAGILDQRLKKFNQLPELNASSAIIQRALPWLVTVAIIDSFWRVPLTA